MVGQTYSLPYLRDILVSTPSSARRVRSIEGSSRASAGMCLADSYTASSQSVDSHRNFYFPSTHALTISGDCQLSRPHDLPQVVKCCADRPVGSPGRGDCFSIRTWGDAIPLQLPHGHWKLLSRDPKKYQAPSSGFMPRYKLARCRVSCGLLCRTWRLIWKKSNRVHGCPQRTVCVSAFTYLVQQRLREPGGKSPWYTWTWY